MSRLTDRVGQSPLLCGRGEEFGASGLHSRKGRGNEWEEKKRMMGQKDGRVPLPGSPPTSSSSGTSLALASLEREREFLIEGAEFQAWVTGRR